ncbi:MAG: glycine-rich domain-containing protein, partial [Kiritimatiellia bacterium]
MRQRSILTAMSIGALAFSVIGAAHAAPQPAKGAFADIVSATGGTVTNYIDAEGVSWIAHSFTTVGTNRFTVKSAGEVEYLVVGGGGGGGAGGGGSGGGGGGGGNAVIGKNLSLSAGSYNVVVGAGGAKAQDGGSSAFSDIVAGGGNRGASAEGGVGGACTSTVYGTTTGYTGGTGHSANPQRAGGGGAGSGANGGAAAPHVGGNGGAGVVSSITGVTTNYGGGGGGGAECTSNPPGQGGAGGGGSGEANVPYVPGGYSGNTPCAGYQPATPGVNGLGGGGGGAGGFSGVVAGLGNTPGGSGLVVVRYMTDPNAPIIQNQPVANVTTTSASFNGLLVRTGTTACAVCVLWGEQDGGNTWNWAHTNWFFGGKATPALGNGLALKTNITTGIGKNKVYWYTYAAMNATSKEVASPSKSFFSGPVQVEATVDNAQYTTRNGVFTISRPPGCTNTAVTVAYTLSGTATNGTHYTGLDNRALPLYATIEAGAVSKVVTLKSMPVSPARTALLTLTSASDNGYPVSAASYTGAVTLLAFAGKVWNGAADTAWNNP